MYREPQTKEEREYVKALIQDMRVKLRDIQDYAEGKKYRDIIKKFEKGFEEEYKHI